MLNSEYVDRAMKDLQKVDSQYKEVLRRTIYNIERLQNSRKNSINTIQRVEKYIEGLANRRRDIDTKLGKIRLNYKRFIDVMQRLERVETENRQSSQTAKIGMAGTLGGLAVSQLGGHAAVSIAMLFGTSSTGIAISSLTGAAATNAALAWLGGGALAAGGAGVAGGSTMVAAMGPIGWVIGGVSLAATLIAINLSNEELGRKLESSIRKIKKEITRIEGINVKVSTWNKETIELSNSIMRTLTYLNKNPNKNINNFTDDEIKELMILLNSSEVLSKKIGSTISR